MRQFSFKRRLTRGFSSLEVAMIILIISILIVGTYSSIVMIKKFHISTAKTLTSSSPVHSISESSFWMETSMDSSLNVNETHDGSPISSWTDIRESLNKNNAAQNNPSNAPSYYYKGINHIPAIKFSGTNNFTVNGAVLNNTDYTIFVVEQRDSGKSGNYFIGDASLDATSSANQNLVLGYSADGTVIHSQSSDNKYSSGISTFVESRGKPRVFVFQHSSLNGKKTYINGVLAATSDDKTHLNGITTLKIGSAYEGQIGEVIAFSRALKDEERESIQDYLSQKWGVKNLAKVISGNCVGGVVGLTQCSASCAVPSTPGILTATVADGSGSISCDTSNHFSGSLSYSCSNGSFSFTGSSSCSCETGYTGSNCSSCDTGYYLFGGSCAQGCSTGSTVGLNTTNVAVGSGSKNCDATNFNTSDSFNYSCNISGNFTITSGACNTCVSGYSFAANQCLANCTVPAGNTGVVTGTSVDHGSTSISCNDPAGYSGTLTYTCSDGTFTAGTNSCTRTCSTSGTTGLAAATINAGTSTRSCNATGFDPTQQISVTCSGTTGLVTVNGTSCNTCASGYTFASNQCLSNCTVSAGNTGVTAGTPVNHGSTSVSCNAAGYTGTLSYTCNNGTFTAGTNNCLRTCSTSGTTGLAETTVNPGTSTRNCDATNFNSSQQVSITCSGTTGAITVNGTGCNTCASGYTFASNQCSANCTVPAGNTGVVTGTVVDHGSTSISCNDPAGYSGTLTYTCNNGTFNAGTNNCLRTCSTSGTTGLATATINAGTSNRSCDGTNFNPSQQVNITCSGTTGLITVNGTGCNTCSSGYTFASNQCLSNCTVPSGVTGVTAGTAVNHGSTSVSCNASGYTGTLSYTCNNGTFTAGTNNCTVASTDCTGGTKTTAGGKTIHSFTTVGSTTFQCPTARNVEVLVVAGGGAGGAGNGGGGGAGGVVYNSSFAVSTSSVTVTVGAGGVAQPLNGTNAAAANGSNSVFSTITAIGGGGGGNDVSSSGGFNAQNGGSGGGAKWNNSTRGTGTSGQGNNGGTIPGSNGNYTCGGGGGAGAAGGTPGTNATVSGAGGAGASYFNAAGGSSFYGGGGGGCGSFTQAAGGAGGTGGGGAAATHSTYVAVAGTANTGGGGGAGAWAGGSSTRTGANGGSGIVLVRY